MRAPDVLPVEIGGACRQRLGEFPDFSDTDKGMHFLNFLSPCIGAHFPHFPTPCIRGGRRRPPSRARATKKRRMRAAQHRRGGKMITRAWQNARGYHSPHLSYHVGGMEGKRQRAGRVRRQSHRQGAPLPLRAAAGGRLSRPASRRPACIRGRGAFIDRQEIDASMENFRYRAAKQAGTGRGISKIF